MDIQIEPSVKSYEIVKVAYQIDTLVANQFCKISAFLVEPDGNRIKRIQLMLEGEEYTQWGNDDDWLLDWICAKCGVSRYVPPPPPPEELRIEVPEEVPPTL